MRRAPRPATGPQPGYAAPRPRGPLRAGLHWLCPLLLAVAALLGRVSPAHGQPRDWVLSQIETKNSSLRPAVRAEKYAAMAESALAFFRATNHVYWTDFGHSPLLSNFGGPTTRIWIQGDAHAENIGALSNNHNDIIYELDDFDEVVIGDYQLDLWRMAISLILLARENGGFSPADQDALLDALSTSYLNTVASYRGNNNELTQVFTASNTPNRLADFLTDIAHQASRPRMLGRSTVTERGTRKFDFNKLDLLPMPNSFLVAVQAAMTSYTATLAGRVRHMQGYFQVKDVAHRVNQGLGSRGLPRYYVLIEGPTTSQDDDRILDIKLQGVPSGWPYMEPLLRTQLAELLNGDQAMRTVLGNRVLGYRVDEHLGTMTLFGESYSVRERTPARGTFDIHQLRNIQRASSLAGVWGAVLATAHARADEDSSPLIPYDFERELLLKVGRQRAGFMALVRQVALHYAVQVESDYKAFLEVLVKPMGPINNGPAAVAPAP